MASGNETTILSRNTNIVLALCTRFSLDPKVFLTNVDKDLKSLCVSILKSSPKYASLEDDNEIMKWIEFADSFTAETKTCISALEKLNEDLIPKSVLLGVGFQPSEADTIVYLTILPSLVTLPDSDKHKLSHLMRWADYIQERSMDDVVKQLERVSINKAPFDPPAITPVAKVDKESNAKKSAQGTKEKKAATSKEAPAEKKVQEKAGDEKDKEVSVSLLKIQIGLIRKAYKHPSADSLLVEEIDVGEAKVRQVVSGLAKYFSPENLTNRLVALITNVKPGKLRDVVSEGLVLCASNDDHSVVEPLIVPEGAKIGERVTFSGHDGKPEDVLNPKKKQLDKITPNLYTDEKGVATFKGIPFMTSSGPCSSSIPKATIK